MLNVINTNKDNESNSFIADLLINTKLKHVFHNNSRFLGTNPITILNEQTVCGILHFGKVFSESWIILELSFINIDAYLLY